MRKISDSECCGCGLCAQTCPRKCIDMQPDIEGFLIPQIDETQCVHCGLCKQFCPVNKSLAAQAKAQSAEEKHCFYAVSANEAQVAAASSGGIFPMLAQNILKKGGAVVGAAFDDKFNVSLILLEDVAELPKLLQAKYVQAYMPQEIFEQSLNVLQEGRPLLFAGTPCQIAAFRSFCGDKHFPGLLCVEVICHGVPSPAVWQSYLKHVARQVGNAIRSVAFRDKVYGWHKFALTISGNSGVLCQSHKYSPYMQLFLNELISRKSCSVCVFKNGCSGADLSLGDFWKLRKIAPELNNNTGASMVIVHTQNGMDKLKDGELLILKEFPMETVKVSNRAYSAAIKANPLREKYFFEFAKSNQQWISASYFFKKEVSCKKWLRFSIFKIFSTMASCFRKIFSLH